MYELVDTHQECRVVSIHETFYAAQSAADRLEVRWLCSSERPEATPLNWRYKVRRARCIVIGVIVKS